MFSISSFSLLTNHIYLVSKNRTTLESFRHPKFSEGCKNGFNLGCYKNIQEVFGKEVLLWPLQIHTSLGDDIVYSLTSDNDLTMYLAF